MTTRTHARRLAGAVVGGLVAAALVAVPAHAAAPATTITTIDLKFSSVVYGDTPEAKVWVDAEFGGSVKPTGTVTLVVGGQSVTGEVDASGKALIAPPLVDAAATPYAVSASFAPADPAAFAASTAVPVELTVSQDSTTSEATARLKKRKRRLIGVSTVTSQQGQPPGGTVTFVARRNGKKIGTKAVALNGAARAKVWFAKVKPTGAFKVVAKYSGSTNFTASKDAVTLGAR